MLVADLSADDAAREIGWLGRVLAGRGMPRLLLEKHLTHLAEAMAPLEEGDPVWVRRRSRLTAVAASLTRARVGALPQDGVAALVTAFDAGAPAQSHAILPGAGALLVAAVADERLGARRAVESVTEWIATDGRFSAGWVRAVDELVEALRALPEG